MMKTARRLYGALILLSDDDNLVEANIGEIAKVAGYKATGGMHTFALMWLDEHNKITKEGKNKWRIHL